MKCPTCSFFNEESHRFCGECGTSLVIAEEGPEILTETLKLPDETMIPGTTFAGRYRIIDELGRGGMGRVFRVTDTKLGEEIALKLIKPDSSTDPKAIERFKNELKAARQIVHKNVARVFDLNEEKGIPYITMEFVKGEHLKLLINKVGRLSPGQTVPIARHICEGLAEAHRLGVIHRDLKPQNIVIDEEGKAKILDFGLARLQKAEATTETGEVIATPAYIAPERVEGLPADGRSDLYSLGIVLYEMLTGKTPFEGDSSLSLALKHVQETPLDPRKMNAEIPEGLSVIIMRCLEKSREKRYQSAEELIADLSLLEKDFKTREILRLVRRARLRKFMKRMWELKIPQISTILAALVITGAIIIPGKRQGIAILPVLDLSPQGNQASLCSGLQDDVIQILSGIQSLRVLPTLSVRDYDTGGKNSRKIGKELGVSYLVEMQLYLDDEKITVNADLINAVSDTTEHQFSLGKDKENFFALRNEIARDFSRALEVQLAEETLNSLRAREPKDLEAYILYLDAMALIEDGYHETRRTEDFNEAVSKYKKAIKIDPNYVLAYWGLGNAFEAHYNNSGRKDPDDLEKMKYYYEEAHAKSRQKNPEFAETYLGLGWSHFNKKDNEIAAEFFKKAHELAPNDAMVNLDVGAFMRSVGLYSQAIEYFSNALDSDPLFITPLILISSCEMCLGKFKKAAKRVTRVIDKDPQNFIARIFHTTQLIMMGKVEEAEKELEKARNITPYHPDIAPIQALLWAARGDKDKALAALEEGENFGLDVTSVYILLGMKDEAIRNIEMGIERGFEDFGDYLYSYPCLAGNPVFRGIQDDPRFREILRKEKAKFQDMKKRYGRM